MAQAMRNPQHHRRVEAVEAFVRDHEQSISPGYFRGRQHVAAVIVVVFLAVVAFRAFPQQEVTVLNDGRSVQVTTTLNLRAEALDAASIRLNPSDRVQYARGGNQSSIAIHRAKTVNIEVDGQILAVNTHASTVSGALAAAGIELNKGDVILVNGSAATERAPLSHAPRPATFAMAAPAGELLAVYGDTTPVITVVRARPVSVLIDTVRIEIHSAAETVRGVLDDMGIIVREGDLVSPGLDAAIGSGETIQLAKARSVEITLDGAERTMYTQADTVGGILRVLDIELGPEDSVTPSPETPVSEGMAITIDRTIVVEEDVEESIPPQTVYETDPQIPSGETRVVQGTPGVRVVTHRVTYRNGEEIAREVVSGSARVEREPEPTRFISGVQRQPGQPPVPSSVDSPDFSGEYRKKVTVLATWYNATHGGKERDDPWFGITATGVKLDKGICATDPNYIPLGTWMYIPGYGTCLAADVGGGVRGYHVDLGFPESAGNNPWGTKTLDIYILD